MMNSYWMVNEADPDEDKFIYSTEVYEIGETVDGWRVIDREVTE